MGFNYEIHYKSGVENVAANVLSRVQGSELLLMAISVIHSDLQQRIVNNYALDLNLTTLVEQLQQGGLLANFALTDGLLRYKGKIVVGPDVNLHKTILDWHHNSSQGEEMLHSRE